MRRSARHSALAATAPTTMPAGTNFVPSQGSAPRRAKQANASYQAGPAWSLVASSAAPASAAPAGSSGYTAVP